MRQRVLFAGAAACGAAALCLNPCLPGTEQISGITTSVTRLLVPEAHSETASLTRIDYLDKVPSRKEQLQKLASGSEHNPFDVLIIGGGATGTGCALDAVTR